MRLNASPAWRYFTKLSPTSAQCLICEAILPVKKGSTSSLLAHVRYRHSTHWSGGANREESLNTESKVPIVIPFSRAVSSHNVASVDPRENILSSLARHCGSSESSQDVKIFCQDGQLSAHRIVLASVSNMLYEEFLDNSVLETVIIMLPDFTKGEVGEFLQDVYHCVDLSHHASLNSVLGVNLNIKSYDESPGFDENISKGNIFDEIIEKEEEDLDVNFENMAEVESNPITIEKSRKSFVWNHFSEEGNMVVCNHCGNKMANYTSNMTHHILSNHFKEVNVEHLPKRLKPSLDSEPVETEAYSGEAEEQAAVSRGNEITKRISEDELKCLICMKIFSTKSNCQLHWKTVHSGSDPYKCQICDKKFTRKDTLESHMKSHDNLREFMCSQCGKRFNRKRVRDMHEKGHHRNDYKKACSFCGKKFLNNQSLLRHERVHTGEKPYQVRKIFYMTWEHNSLFQCEQCSRRFKQKDQLTAHLRVHTGEKPYQCEQCLVWFKHYSSRKNHKCKTDLGLELDEESNK